MELQVCGAAEEVTGSCYLIKHAGQQVLVDCGLIQGSHVDEARNAQAFPFDVDKVDAVVLTHAHIDHSGRIPLLVKRGYNGPIYTQKATKSLCRIMLKDAAFLNEKEAIWENKKRQRKGLNLFDPLYTTAHAIDAMQHFRAQPYNKVISILPGIKIRFNDAGHILGSAIVEIWLEHKNNARKLVFSGDLGQKNKPILRDPTIIKDADLVVMESTYGDRLHRPFDETLSELADIFTRANRGKSNIIIPSFTVGRTQELLYLFSKYHNEWGLDRWHIFLDSPMAIEATEIYHRYTNLYDNEASHLWSNDGLYRLLPNLHFCRTTNQSMALNRLESGAIIIAGSGMCTGGRIKHHLKNHVWRKNCHLIIPGFQARGTTGRAIIDGAKFIQLWGETVKVAAKVHTIGGLSAHADQQGLIEWYQGFNHKPPLLLVHGEIESLKTLAGALASAVDAPVTIARPGMTLNLAELD